MTSSGIYHHYKGGHYRVLFEAKVSTNGKDEGKKAVVYCSLTTGCIHVRDYDQFHESVSFPGEDGRINHRRRFVFVGEALLPK